LQPYADEYVPALARDRARVLVVMPGFTADCLETLEEVGLRLRSAFRAAGGDELVVVPSLNDHPAWIDAMEGMVRRWSATQADG
jgi:ferrochelatase